MDSKEARLQAECVKWYRNEWRKNQNHLWSTNNEGRDINTKISMGMLPGVSDLLLKDHRGLIGLEAKYKGCRHDRLHVIRQATWILDACDSGGFFDNLQQFQKIVKGKDVFYPASDILRYLIYIQTKTFIWDYEIITSTINS